MTTKHAAEAGIEAIQNGITKYCPSIGIPELREAVAKNASEELNIDVSAENIVIGHGGKPFQGTFCEAFLNPGDSVLVFSPYFPTYVPSITRRNAQVHFSDLKQETDFRPNIEDIERFLKTANHPKAIFLNSPHNPTGGVATEQDFIDIADLLRGKDIAIFSDEPYLHMAFADEHRSPLQQPGMLEQTVAAYTFSKSYNMSGWRLGYAIASKENAKVIGDLTNTALSCVPPFIQKAGVAALEFDRDERDANMQKFKKKIELLAEGLDSLDEIKCLTPAGTFYVFPNVKELCNRLKITSHGLAMYLLEYADDEKGIACLGGESFGAAGKGFLRFSCAQSDERIEEALAFLPIAFSRTDRIASYLQSHPEFQLTESYE